MLKYLLKRILHGIISVIIVIGIIIVIVYSLLDRKLIFQGDSEYSKKTNNVVKTYEMKKWQEYGYVDYINYSDYLAKLQLDGEISSEDITQASNLLATATATETATILVKDSDSKVVYVEGNYILSGDNALAKEYITKFVKTYQDKGYTIARLYKMLVGSRLATNGNPTLYAYKDRSVFTRIWSFFSGILTFDNIHYATEDVGDRGISFTFFDPAYGGNVFAPAIMGNGTKHRYLLYFDGKFPFIHQNLITITLGKSFSQQRGLDVFEIMTNPQGDLSYSDVTFPTGVVVNESAVNIHTLTYSDAVASGSDVDLYGEGSHYINVENNKVTSSRIALSFIIGIFSVILSYLIAVPLGILMARKKDKLADKLGTIYIVFIMAVPSLAYILMFKALGQSMGLPTTFDTNKATFPYFVLPVISLALPSIASLMKWLRRYMIDQMNSDYVKFARSGGLSEQEIFTKHIFKNAAIPLVHGIPGTVLGCLVGAIITETVYVVPGTGGLLTDAIHTYDNSVIVGVAFFYAVLSIISLILGDILISMMDPRISFSTKGR
mgnify:CR=1 FL=1